MGMSKEEKILWLKSRFRLVESTGSGKYDESKHPRGDSENQGHFRYNGGGKKLQQKSISQPQGGAEEKPFGDNAGTQQQSSKPAQGGGKSASSESSRGKTGTFASIGRGHAPVGQGFAPVGQGFAPIGQGHAPVGQGFAHSGNVGQVATEASIVPVDPKKHVQKTVEGFFSKNPSASFWSVYTDFWNGESTPNVDAFKNHLKENNIDLDNKDSKHLFVSAFAAKYTQVYNSWVDKRNSTGVCPQQGRVPSPTEDQLEGSEVSLLDHDELTAVDNYTQNEYRALNTFLRDGLSGNKEHDNRMKESCEVLIGAMAKTKPLKAPLKVYRGYKFDETSHQANFVSKLKEAHKNGQIMKLDGFVSTCKTGVAEAFDGTCVVEIEASQGINAQEVSTNDTEEEFLINHGCDYEVKHVEQNSDGFVTVHLKQLNNGAKPSEESKKKTQPVKKPASPSKPNKKWWNPFS